MIMSRQPNAAAIQSKGWLLAHKWLLARRFSQLTILALFMIGPWFGLWLIKGNLNSSLILETVPLTDPYVLLQSLFAGHSLETTAIIGAAIVLVFYLLVSGRVYCSWVCPVNMVTDLAHWLRQRLNIKNASSISKNARYWLLAVTLLLAFTTSNLAWETVNPVSMMHRSLIFGMGMAWAVLLAVFLYDLLVSRRGWCSHLCPVGAFYSLLATHSPLRVRADAREECDDCMDCFLVCPEQQVIRPALKGADKNIGPVITSANCTNCGRCIDVCAKEVFHFGLRFNNKPNYKHNINNQTNHSTGAEVL